MKITLLQVKITLRHRVLQQLSARRVQQWGPCISLTQRFTHRVLTTLPPPAVSCRDPSGPAPSSALHGSSVKQRRGENTTTSPLFPSLPGQALPSAHFPAEHL